MEKFLLFWSQNNSVIIEVLVALILVSTIYLVYRGFFGPKTPDGFSTAPGVGVDTAHIEKTLQKILEQQGNNKAASGSSSALSGSGTAPAAELVQEIASMKKALDEKDKQIVVLQEKAAAALKAAQAPNAPPSADAIAAAAQAAAGLAEKERNDYEAKIKELEARLAEYEIISEDIADLSFFKEENARLTKELEDLKAAGIGAPAAASVYAAPAATPPVARIEEAPAPPLAAAFEVAVPEPMKEEASATMEANAAQASVDATNAIDDSLMAEFAKAVESQKADTLDTPPKKDENENDKLLAEFENFNKKS